MKILFLTHRYYLLLLIGMLIPIAFGMGWLSMLLIVPFLVLLTGLYLSRRFVKGQLQSVVNTGLKLLLLIVYTMISKLYVFDIYQVNSSSMEGALIKGDVLFINKLAYGPQEIDDANSISWVKLFRSNIRQEETCPVISRKHGYTHIRRNDVFIYELFPAYFVVKRCAGLPGDHLKISNDTTFINNRYAPFSAYHQNQYLVKFRDHAGLKAYLSSVSRSAIDSVNIDSNILVVNVSQNDLPQHALRVTRLPNKLLAGKMPYFRPDIWTINNLGPLTIPYKGWSVADSALYRNTIEHWECNNTPEGYVFRDNYYFMMGDNKPYSEDSRYLGLIPERKIVGKVAFILYSYNEKGFLWNRLFKNIL
ncbi:signal peptidase I [Chitinophaga pinensis]|uniref:Signal peptidase I n=1 Tax=Chitinophaga pinensis (strain ATCC 43595 / DSM 2588 / LMG 13176 / NBRC 15968 / NCIMB 11800 / UQM 2034) TaxID=485918 RepID=A0A979G3E2_CHIPD|nr:signal peptidase I [Chitinophaga pinensis]ACU59948.1 signal peptidase I [Chitinophaga pinensis DSM 2588]